MPFCRMLPHGYYSLLPTVLAIVALIAGHARDSCRYAKLTEGEFFKAIALTMGNVEISYLEVGLNAFRIPGSAEDMSDVLGLDDKKQCLKYPEGVLNIDPIWHVARATSFLAVVLGGGAAFYLCISICCRFNRSSWRCAAYEMLLAAFFQCVSFIWFKSEICRLNKCHLDVGSKTDIAAIVLWVLAAAAVLWHYPKPPELTEGDGVMASDGDLELNDNTNDNDATKEEEDALKEQEGEMATGEDTRQQGHRPLEDVQLT